MTNREKRENKEDALRHVFREAYSKELSTLYVYLDDVSETIKQIPIVKTSEPEDEWIAVVLIHSYTTLLSALIILETGYMPQALALLRGVVEGITYCMFFHHFPGMLAEYTNLENREQGYIFPGVVKDKYEVDGVWIEPILRAIPEDNDFKVLDPYSKLYKRLGEVLSKFVHVNYANAAASLVNTSIPSIREYGPKGYQETDTRLAFSHLTYLALMLWIVMRVHFIPNVPLPNPVQENTENIKKVIKMESL